MLKINCLFYCSLGLFYVKLVFVGENIMAFCKFSTGFVADSSIVLDSMFLNDYVPYAPESCLKVYLFGLLKCYNSASYDNTIENFEQVLNMSKEDIKSAFLYWEDQNLVKVLQLEPEIEVRYLPVKTASKHLKKFKVEKYSSFALSAQEILARPVSTNEVNEYITLIESFSMQPEALLMIMKYCTGTKGEDVNYQYILTVAKNWAKESILTTEKVEEKITELNNVLSEGAKIATALKYKGNLSYEQQKLFLKWTRELGFELGTIIHIAKKISKQTSRNGFERLDAALTKYYEQKLFSILEIDEYEENKTALISLAKQINKAIGLYYENVENIIDTYILDWIKKGYNEEALVQIANFCFKSNIRTLDGMNNTINKFYKLGYTTLNGITQYLEEKLSQDSEIKEILTKLNIDRKVNSYDRDMYNMWTSVWKLSKDMIDHATTLSAGKSSPMQYLNQILSTWHNAGLKTLAEAKAYKNAAPVSNSTSTKPDNKVITRSYSASELETLFDNLDEVEI